MFNVWAWDNDRFYNSLHYPASIDANGQSAGRAFVPQFLTSRRASYVSIVTLRVKTPTKLIIIAKVVTTTSILEHIKLSTQCGSQQT